jgi:hypothetical protein
MTIEDALIEYADALDEHIKKGAWIVGWPGDSKRITRAQKRIADHAYRLQRERDRESSSVI